MKAAYNQNDIGLHPLTVFYGKPRDLCANCIFIRSEERTCLLSNFDEDTFDKLARCWNAIFIPEPLSNIFKL